MFKRRVSHTPVLRERGPWDTMLMPIWFDHSDQIQQGNTRGEGECFYGSDTPHPTGGARPPIFGTPIVAV